MPIETFARRAQPLTTPLALLSPWPLPLLAMLRRRARTPLRPQRDAVE